MESLWSGLPSLQAATAACQSLGTALETRWSQAEREEKRAVLAAGTAATALAAALVLARRRRHRQRQSKLADDDVVEDEDEPVPEPGTISSLEQLRAYRQPLLGLGGGPDIQSVVVTRQGLKLTAIPLAVCSMWQLKELDLRGNALSEVPAALGGLTGLTRLNLSGNQLTALPETLGRLHALLDLDVSACRLAALPESLGCLTALRYLNAMGNRLQALPASIGGCTALVRLGLKNNQLRELPASIGKLAALQELYLTDNLLESLPPQMGDMVSLVKLQASFNRLKSLPAELGRLPRLEMLRVASCEIEEVPAALRDAPRLAWMSLASNPVDRPLAPRKLPVVELKDLGLGRKLGDGASGEVFLGSWKGRRVAVKIFVAERSPDGHSRDEMAIACSVSEKHLVRVLAIVEKPLGLVMEFAEGTPIAEKPNLQSLLRCRWAPGQSFALGWVLRVAQGVAGALEHMHYRGIAHGDVYAHNVMADEEGHATLCDYGASFPYHKGGPVPYEAHEVRAFGLMLADMVQRIEVGFQGMQLQMELLRELQSLVQACIGGPPARRPTFGAVGRRLRAIQKQAARAGLASVVTPRSEAGSIASMTPRSCMTEYMTPLSSRSFA